MSDYTRYLNKIGGKLQNKVKKPRFINTKIMLPYELPKNIQEMLHNHILSAHQAYSIGKKGGNKKLRKIMYKQIIKKFGPTVIKRAYMIHKNPIKEIIKHRTIDNLKYLTGGNKNTVKQLQNVLFKNPQIKKIINKPLDKNKTFWENVKEKASEIKNLVSSTKFWINLGKSALGILMIALGSYIAYNSYKYYRSSWIPYYDKKQQQIQENIPQMSANIGQNIASIVSPVVSTNTAQQLGTSVQNVTNTVATTGVNVANAVIGREGVLHNIARSSTLDFPPGTISVPPSTAPTPQRIVYRKRSQVPLPLQDEQEIHDLIEIATQQSEQLENPTIIVEKEEKELLSESESGKEESVITTPESESSVPMTPTQQQQQQFSGILPKDIRKAAFKAKHERTFEQRLEQLEKDKYVTRKEITALREFYKGTRRYAMALEEYKKTFTSLPIAQQKKINSKAGKEFDKNYPFTSLTIVKPEEKKVLMSKQQKPTETTTTTTTTTKPKKTGKGLNHFPNHLINNKEIEKQHINWAMLDELYEKIPNSSTSLTIVNLDKSTEPGSHWVVLIISHPSGKAFYIDPFSEKIQKTPIQIKQYIKSLDLKLIANKIQIQPLNSNLCGYLAIYLVKQFKKALKKHQQMTVEKFNKIIIKSFGHSPLSDQKQIKLFTWAKSHGIVPKNAT